ncbi:MAG: cysteine hydrolase family protein, partial [Armatimonadota bacterium]
NIARLIDGCRIHGLPVVFTRLVARDSRDVTLQASITGFWAQAGSDDAEFLSDLKPHAGEVVIDKTSTGPFTGGGLQSVLQERRVHGLVIAGVLANGTVEQTARDAADLGYGVIVVSDACAAETWAIHSFVMTTVVGGLIRTRSTSAMLEMLDGRRT